MPKTNCSEGGGGGHQPALRRHALLQRRRALPQRASKPQLLLLLPRLRPPRLRGRAAVRQGDVHERALRHAGGVQEGNES